MADRNPDFDAENIQSEEGDDFVKHLRSIWNHKWVVLTVTVACFALSTFSQYKKPDYYSATSRVIVHKLDSSMLPYSEMSVPQSLDATYFETQVEIIRGMPIAKKVAQSLNLPRHYGVDSVEQAASILRQSVTPMRVRNTQILTITVTNNNPEWAAKIANELAEAYKEEALKDRLFVNEQILEWFPDAKGGVKADGAAELLKKIEDVNFAMQLPSIANDPGVRRLKQEQLDIEARIRELLTRYTPEHPQVKELTGRLEYLDSELRVNIDKITASVKTALAGQFNVSNIKVLEKAQPPRAPAGPNRQKGILSMTLIGLAIGIAIAIFLDSIDKTVKTDEDILGIGGLPYLGSVPKVAGGKRKAPKGLVALDEFVTNTTVSDAMTSLNTALLFSMPKGQNKFIMVTSAIPSEGKTTIAYLLAMSMARLGNKVLCVELDLRRPSLSTKMCASAAVASKGIADYLVGQATFEEVVQTSQSTPNLDVIFAGGSSPNPTTLFTSNAFDEFLKFVSQKYDRIIFDSPPSLQIPDPIILSNKMHGVVFVIGAGMVHRNIVHKTVRKFTFVGSTIFGAVINRVNFKKSGYGGYNYYYGKSYGTKGQGGAS